MMIWAVRCHVFISEYDVKNVSVRWQYELLSAKGQRKSVSSLMAIVLLYTLSWFTNTIKNIVILFLIVLIGNTKYIPFETQVMFVRFWCYGL